MSPERSEPDSGLEPETVTPETTAAVAAESGKKKPRERTLGERIYYAINNPVVPEPAPPPGLDLGAGAEPGEDEPDDWSIITGRAPLPIPEKPSPFSDWDRILAGSEDEGDEPEFGAEYTPFDELNFAQRSLVRFARRRERKLTGRINRIHLSEPADHPQGSTESLRKLGKDPFAPSPTDGKPDPNKAFGTPENPYDALKGFEETTLMSRDEVHARREAAEAEAPPKKKPREASTKSENTHALRANLRLDHINNRSAANLKYYDLYGEALDDKAKQEEMIRNGNFNRATKKGIRAAGRVVRKNNRSSERIERRMVRAAHDENPHEAKVDERIAYFERRRDVWHRRATRYDRRTPPTEPLPELPDPEKYLDDIE